MAMKVSNKGLTSPVASQRNIPSSQGHFRPKIKIILIFLIFPFFHPFFFLFLFSGFVFVLHKWPIPVVGRQPPVKPYKGNARVAPVRSGEGHPRWPQARLPLKATSEGRQACAMAGSPPADLGEDQRPKPRLGRGPVTLTRSRRGSLDPLGFGEGH